MKIPNNITWLMLTALMAAFIVTTTKCTHEDQALEDIIDSTFEYGTDVINAAEGYAVDIGHSSVRWESPYTGVGALLTGRFDDFTLEIDFDEANPENITLSGSVDLTTVNTGSPGRDDGCLQGTLGSDVSDEATFVSTGVTQDGVGGYNVTGEFTFHGATSEIVGKLTYVRSVFFDAESGVRCAPLYIGGFMVEFDILAKSVHGIESGNIADVVHIICSAQVKYIIDPDNC